MKRNDWYMLALGFLWVIAMAGWGKYLYLHYQLQQEYNGYVHDARATTDYFNKMVERDLREIDRLQKEAAAETAQKGERRKQDKD